MMPDNPSITSQFQGPYIFLATLILLNVLVIYHAMRSSQKESNSTITAAWSSFASLLLASGGFGVFFTLFRYFSVLEIRTDSRPGQWELVLPLAVSLLVFMSSGAAFWVVRNRLKEGK
ncbi:MAG: hypothetical protein JST46_14985 [Bacteroidetes bacterium]|nr:hypothetical protein [Bacteroidota bacterium]